MPVPKIKSENENQIHFLTFTTIEWIDIFTKIEYFELLYETMQYCRKNMGLKIYGYVFMTNHLHNIWQARQGSKLSKVVQSFKRHTTLGLKELVSRDNRKYIQGLIKTSKYKRPVNSFQVWQNYNWPEVVENERFFLQKLNYIHDNPVKKGYVAKIQDWNYSSARNYIEQNFKDIDRISV